MSAQSYIASMHPLRVTRKKLDSELVLAQAKAITEKIVVQAKPLAVFLFGSAAEGRATDQSDFDFVVVMQDLASMKLGQKALAKIRPLASAPVDLVWVTKEEFLKKREIGGVCLIAWEDGETTFIASGEHELTRI